MLSVLVRFHQQAYNIGIKQLFDREKKSSFENCEDLFKCSNNFHKNCS